jgi:hypothetical protein
MVCEKVEPTEAGFVAVGGMGVGVAVGGTGVGAAWQAASRNAADRQIRILKIFMACSLLQNN